MKAFNNQRYFQNQRKSKQQQQLRWTWRQRRWHAAVLIKLISLTHWRSRYVLSNVLSLLFLLLFPSKWNRAQKHSFDPNQPLFLTRCWFGSFLMISKGEYNFLLNEAILQDLCKILVPKETGYKTVSQAPDLFTYLCMYVSIYLYYIVLYYIVYMLHLYTI